VVDLRDVPSATPAGSPGAARAGGATWFCARPGLHLGAAHPAAAAFLRADADDHGSDDHPVATDDYHDDAGAPAAAALPTAAALLSGHDDPHQSAQSADRAARTAAWAGPDGHLDAAGTLNFAPRRNTPLHWRAVMITLEHVTKQYKSSARPALDDINVKIDKGEFVFLIGPSGSGKSTFMRLLLAAENPSSGDIRVSKFHVNKLRGRNVPKLRQVIGCVFQDFRLLQQKSVYDNVAFALEVIGRRTDAINRVVPEVLETVGLSGKANRLPHELSGGEQQRVAIARAYVNRPLVLLADEPTGNLDPDTSKDIMDLLERINRTGTTVLMATHDHHIVDAMRQRVVELSLGRLVRDEQRGVYGMDR
jgi:cell division transport system ATP-binding protein